jgi:homocysteine S-methyltransferase
MARHPSNPFAPFLGQQGFVLLDGGLATELERLGHDLDDPLWSARLLRDDPEAIARVHDAYLRAGADCLVTASYQATLVGFERRGVPRDEAIGLIRRAVAIACAARDRFWAVEANRTDRVRPLVAASVGPYGAFLANGAEYTGEYDLDENGLFQFHQERWRILASAGADVLACETVPSAPEARALARLLEQTPDVPAWVSFSCRDDRCINDGIPLVDAVAPFAGLPQVVALGVNCTAPSYVDGLIEQLRGATDGLIAVYPNSGETYDAARRCWLGSGSAQGFAGAAVNWFSRGARLIGGCCRIGPAHIQAMRRALVARGTCRASATRPAVSEPR